MTDDSLNWDQLQALFHLAEDTPDDRLDDLLLASSPHPELRRRAKALILAGRKSVSEPSPDGSPMLSGRIGQYTILRPLGSGGIGSVYLVERIVGGTVQRSALKMLSQHAAGPFFVERFAREQHILASLDHPNITRMLDAGLTSAGEPYLVMEYVDGVHLDVYCDDLALGIEQRLQLFLKVCDAVSYAHRNLIVHLDLKPSNILATETDGTVKLLDFGTSKLILTDSRLTTTVMATPAYASPEQLRNEAVTTSCDIYSLGAILFELLAGRRPNLDRSIAIMIERSINETPPEWVMDAVTQSAAEQRGMTETRLRSLLRGDLATIVAKCLSPRPKDRYTTVDALITDLQRYLAGRPILARPQTTTYRISKFVRRNRKTVLLGAVAMLTLIASLGYAAWRQEQAYRAGQRALEMQTFMSQLFKLANTSYMGKPAATVPEFLQLGVKVMPDLIKSPADQRFALLSLGESMYADSDYKDAEPVFARVIESAKAAGDLGLEAEAEAYAGKIAYTQGDTERGKILAAHSLSLVNAPGVPPSSRVFIKTFYAQNQEEEGFRTDENVRLMKEAVEESRGHEVSENTLAYAELNLASMLGPRGNLQEEIHLTQDAVNIYSREPYAICDQANAANQLALIRNQTRDFKGSLVAMQESYAGYKRCSGQDSLKTLEVQGYLAAAMLRDGQAKAVIPMLEASMPKWIRLVGPDSDELATPLLFLSNAYIDQGEFGKGEEAASHLIRVEQPRINPLSAQMGVCQLALARALAGGHKDREALVHAELAEKAFIGENSKSPGTMANAAKAHKLLLELRARQ